MRPNKEAISINGKSKSIMPIKRSSA